MIHVFWPVRRQHRTIRSELANTPDGAQVLWHHPPLDSRSLRDSMLIDEHFDDFGCEAAVLLKIANQL
jgi:hypothetical protein